MSCQSRFDARYWMLGAGALRSIFSLLMLVFVDFFPPHPLPHQLVWLVLSKWFIEFIDLFKEANVAFTDVFSLFQISILLISSHI